MNEDFYIIEKGKSFNMLDFLSDSFIFEEEETLDLSCLSVTSMTRYLKSIGDTNSDYEIAG